MSNKNNNFFSSIENTLGNSGLRTESFLLSDSEVGSYWDSSSHVCVIGKDNYGVVTDNLDKLEKIKFPKHISSTQSYIDFTKKEISNPKYNTLLFETNNSVRDYYCPLKKYPTLFHEFSELEYNTSSILNFIKKYGMLGGDIRIEKDNGFHESPYAWYWEIYHMNLAIKLLEYSAVEWSVFTDKWVVPRILEQDNLLNNYFTIDGNKIHLDIKNSQKAKVPAKYFIECYGMLDDDEKNYPSSRILSVLAKKFVQSIIEDHLNYRLKILHNKELKGIEPLSFLSIKTDGLIGSLWLQFYQFAVGLSSFGKCQMCGNWFYESDKRVTTRKKFCSNSCKMSNVRSSALENQIVNKIDTLNSVNITLEEILPFFKGGKKLNDKILGLFKHRVFIFKDGSNYRSDFSIYNNKTGHLLIVFEIKTRKKRSVEKSFSQIDRVFDLNPNIKDGYVFFNQECWGRTKNNKNWKQLGSLNDPKFNPFIKL